MYFVVTLGHYRLVGGGRRDIRQLSREWLAMERDAMPLGARFGEVGPEPNVPSRDHLSRAAARM